MIQEEEILPKTVYVDSIDKEIIDKYGIYEDDVKICISIPSYVSITKKKGFKIYVNKNTYSFINDCCNVSVWRECQHVHVTTF